jgi:hypothetical protein
VSLRGKGWADVKVLKAGVRTCIRVFPVTVVTAIQFRHLKIYAHELERSRGLVVGIVNTICVGDPGIVVRFQADAYRL